MQLPDHGLTPDSLKALLIKNRKEDMAIKAEDMRARLDPEQLINQLLSLYVEADIADQERLEQLKFKANIVNGLLKKCLPDLRSLEISEKANNSSRLIIDISGHVIEDKSS